MENKKLGALIIILSLVFLSFVYLFNTNLSTRSENLRCNKLSEKCVEIGNGISITNVAFGFFGFMFGLGFYFLFFNKTEEAIMKRLEEEKNNKIKNGKFEFAFKMLNPFEAEVLKKVREQDGITQSTLRLRVNMSKSKLSYILQDLEKRKLIKRVKKGKTLGIWLRV